MRKFGLALLLTTLAATPVAEAKTYQDEVTGIGG